MTCEFRLVGFEIKMLFKLMKLKILWKKANEERTFKGFYNYGIIRILVSISCKWRVAFQKRCE